MMSSSPSPPASSNGDRGEEYVTQQRPPAHQDMNFESRPSVLPRYTDHAYQDYSTYIEDGGKIEKHKKSERNFPARLHEMLSDEQYSHIISWMPHGRAFKVLDKKLLVEEAIPKYFGQSKYPSFTRQLSGWGFKRLQRTGPDFGCYYHEFFLRGHPRLTVLMRRIPSGQGKATPNTHAEPDLYAIAEQYPLEKSADVARKAAAASDMESLSNHQWDPYQHYSTLPPQPQLDAPCAVAAAVNWYEDNAVNQPTTSVGQYHSFASEGVGTVAAKKEGDDQTIKSSAKDVMNYDPFPVSNHHFDAPCAAAAAVTCYEGNAVNQPTTSVGQYHYSFASAGVGALVAKKEGDDQTIKSSAQDVMNYDPFPMSNHHFDAPYAAAAVNWCEGNTANQPTKSVCQYHHSFASAGAGTGAAKKEGDDQTIKSSAQGVMNYDPFPMSNHHFDAPYAAAAAVNWYEGNSNTANQPTKSVGQLNHSAQGFHDLSYNSSLPCFSPLKSSFQEDDEESESATKDSKTQS